MNCIEQIHQAFNAFLKKTFSLDDQTLQTCVFDVNDDPAKEEFGDINANAAMVLAKALKQNPRDIAQTIKDGFAHEYVEKIEIAGPGFLNLHLKPEAFVLLVTQLAESGDDFFKLPATTPKKNFNIEFVSANPTGPLHLGHGRGGIIGDVFANIVQFIGHKATREFYINDAGQQMKKLELSFKIRCQQACGLDIPMPEDGYQGQYLVDLAQELVADQGKEILERNDQFFQDYTKERMLAQLKGTLQAYGINFDVWFSEKSLHTSGSSYAKATEDKGYGGQASEVEQAFEILNRKNYLYEKDGALWFKSTEFGDDKDRVIRKSSGDLTYVASDIAYMKNKVERGFDTMIMTLGHDHHSYGVRLEGLRKALGLKATLKIILYQLVKMKASGQQVRMSKRAGNIVTLQGVIDEVGTDVARFFYLNRKADAQLEFDLDLALKKTEENPVYYVQYAYVRTVSILQKAQDEKELQNITAADAEYFTLPGEAKSEAGLIKKMVSLKQLLKNISGNYHTHLLTYYVIELANAFHSYYSKNRVIDTDNIEQSRARLLLIRQLRDVFGLCLRLLGISRPERM